MQVSGRLAPSLIAANVGEEGEGDLRGMRHLFAHASPDSRPAAVLALEGAGSALAVDRALGSRRLRVTVTGAGGHSWADARRPNPYPRPERCLARRFQAPASLQSQDSAERWHHAGRDFC